MSASLVGSEMCIRDSTNTGTSTSTHEYEYEHEHACEYQHESESSCPVSYTHLTLPTICSV
eukprot:11241693-Alexandrium_andersonii.AAC.1